MADEPPLVPLVVPAPSIPSPAVLQSGSTLNAPTTGKLTEGSIFTPMINQSLRDLGVQIDPYVDPSSSLIMNRRPDALAELIARTGKPGPLPIDQVPDIFRPTDLPGGGGRLKPSVGRLGNIFLDYLYNETPMGAVAQGIQAALGQPLLPALERVGQIRDGMNYDYVPGYDIFKDRQIKDAGLSDQMHLFFGSMSPNRTEQIIERVQEKQRQADYVERTGSGAALAEFAAGMLGDPLQYLPATLAMKGPQLAAKALRGGLTGAEMNLVSIPRSVFGTMGDGLVYSGVSGALAVAQRAVENGYDPAKSIEEVVDSLYVPMAISGSMAMLISAFSRRTARSLVQRARDPDFLKATTASGARYVPDDLMGPVIHPTDEAAAGLVSRYDDAATQARRMERTMPGDRFGGPRDKVPFNGVADPNGNLPPGSLATDYGKMRRDEFAAKPENAPYLREHPEFTAFQTGNVVVGPDGKPMIVYHGTNVAFEQFENAKAGTATAGDLPRVAEAARQGHWFVNRPDTASLYAETMAQRHGGAAQVRPAYISLKNPKILEDTEQVWASPKGLDGHVLKDVDGDEWRSTGKTWKMVKGGHELESIPILRTKGSYASEEIAKAKAAGHDGVIIRNSLALNAKGEPAGMQELYVVFDSKSVRGFHERYDVRELKTAAAGPAAEPIPISSNSIDERGRGRVNDASGRLINAKDFPEGQRLSDPKGNILVVRNGTFYPEEIKQTPMASAATGGRGWLPTREEQAAAEQTTDEAYTAAQRLAETKERARIEREKKTEASKVFEADPGMTELTPRALAPGTIAGEHGTEESLVITPDGRIWHLNQQSFEQAREQTDMPLGQHNILGVRYGHLTDPLVKLTTYGDEIAAIGAKGGNTAQQDAALARIKRTWDKEGLGDKVQFEAAPEPLAGKPTNERLGVGEPTPAGLQGAVRVSISDMQPGLFEPGQQVAMVVTPDGKIWQVARIGPSTAEKATALEEGRAGDHAAFFAHHPNLQSTSVVITRFEDQLAASDPRMGRTPQQEAVLRNLKGRWEREGLGDKLFFETADAGSVGAALSPQSLVYQREVLLAQGRMAPTGIGIERWPLSPVHRIFLGESVEAMRAAGDLVSTGGSLTMGNTQRIGSAVPIEVLIQSNWEHMTLNAVRGMKDDWAEARHANAAASAQTQPTSVDFSGRSDIRRLGAEVGDAIKRKFVRGEPGLSYDDFNRRVTAGLRNGDVDTVSDGSTPYVQRSIARHREVYEITKAKMIEHGVFDEAYEGAKFDAYAGVRAVQKDMKEIANRANIERWPADRQRKAEEALMARLEDAEFQAKQAEDQLQKLREHGPQLNGTAPSYAPRMWDAGALKKGEEHFIADIAVPWLMKPTSAGGAGIADTMEATRIAKEMHTLLSKQNPIYERADVKRLFHSVAAPGSAMARTFAIPDELVKDFLVDDAEIMLRYHVKQSATAVEMKRRFGSLDMAEQIAAVEQEYRGQIIAANAGSDVPTEEAKRLVKLMKSDISDLQALRDKLYGTYGAAADPHAWDSRLIRMAKQFANITLLGGSGVSSLGDFVRPLMTEGLDAMYGYGLRSLMGDMRGTILKLGKEDMQLAGVGSDLMNNVRALQAADTGDVFGSRGRLEHGLSTANQWMFVANGLNQITEWSKNWANIIIQGKMNKAIMQYGTLGAEELPEVSPGMVRVWHGGKANPNDLAAVPVHGDFEIQARTHGDQHLWYADVPEDSSWLVRQVTRDVQDSTAPAGTSFTLVGAPGEGKISNFMAVRLANLGIDEPMARRIALQLKVHGKDFDDLKLANIGKWENDDLAAETYKAALNQSVNRTVVTPGIGDRPNILSTELGSLIGQYKSWAIANMTRSLQSGLQEGGSQFWYGAAAAVGFAIVLNELKSRLMYDRSTFDRPATAVIADGIDRSSILGWFSDANRAVETLTGNRLGVKALTGSQPQPIDPARAVGSVAGPAAGQAVRAGSVLNDFISGHPTVKTYNNLRTVMPGSTLPYLDPFYDHLISDGNFHKGMQRSAEKQGRPLQ